MYIPLTNGSQKPEELALTVLKNLVASSLPLTQDSIFLFFCFFNEQVKEPSLNSRFYNAIFMRISSYL
jgi:hypothetical protein